MDPLDKLRGVHVPDAVSFWPPALGWWGLGICLVGLGYLMAWWYRRRVHLAPRRLALRELHQLKTQYERESNPMEFLQGISTLLRRYALACFPRQHVAGLTGHAWLQFFGSNRKDDAFH